jgi:DNA primase
MQYIYRDVDGSPLRLKEKYEDGGYQWFTYLKPTGIRQGAPDSTLTLFNLDRLAQQRPQMIIITEGEKDVINTTEKLGLLAVTSGAALTWGAHHTQQLRDHGVQSAIITPDNDVTGTLSAEEVARHNLRAGVASKIVALPGLADKEDISDWIERGGTQQEFLKLADEAPWLTLADLPDIVPQRKRPTNGKPNQRRTLQASQSAADRRRPRDDHLSAACGHDAKLEHRLGERSLVLPRLR